MKTILDYLVMFSTWKKVLIQVFLWHGWSKFMDLFFLIISDLEMYLSTSELITGNVM